MPDPINRSVTFDSLALSVLAPNVPVPAFNTGQPRPERTSRSRARPSITRRSAPNQERFISSGVGGFQVLMAADVTPSPTGAGPGPQGPAGVGPGVTAPIALVGRVLAVNNGAVRLPIRCALATGALHRHGAAAVRGGRASLAPRRRRSRMKTFGSARVQHPPPAGRRRSACA